MRSTLSQHLPPAALPVREDGSDIDEDEDGEEDGMTRRGPSELAPPTAKELALMGGQSPSFKRSLHKSIASYYSPLARLPPFVPRLLKEDMALNDAKYKAFDQCGARGLGAASKTLSPSMTEFQGAVMIADVKGFTQLTEILSKKGGSKGTGGCTCSPQCQPISYCSLAAAGVATVGESRSRLRNHSSLTPCLLGCMQVVVLRS
jgi:hypothetical protein